MPVKIYANSSANPTAGAVRSEVYPSAVVIPALVKGNKIKYNVFVVDGDGNFDDITGDAGYTCKIAVGPIGGGTPYASITFTTQITNGWEGVLDLSVQAVTDILVGQSSITALWELEITKDADAQPRTYIQQEVTLLNKVNA